MARGGGARAVVLSRSWRRSRHEWISIGAPVVVLGVLVLFLFQSRPHPSELLIGAISVVICLAAWQYPVGSLTCALFLLSGLSLFPSYNATIAVVASLYALVLVVARAPFRFAVVGSGGFVLALAAASQVWVLSPSQQAQALMPWLFLLVFGVGLGLVARRSLQARERQAAEAEQRRKHERADLARQLHDTVARSNSLIVLQAENGRALSDDPEARRYFSEILELGRANGQALQALVGALSLAPDEEETAVEHSEGSSLAQLVHEQEKKFLAHGFTPEFRLQANLDDITPESLTWCRRVLGEALHNVLKYGERGQCRLIVADTDDGAVDIMCVSRVQQGLRDRADGTGFGLSYLRSSLERLGGELVAGPSPSGPHWIFNATVPRSL